MPVIPDDDPRRVILDARPGRYLCFPDVAFVPENTGPGRLIVAYNDFDQHVGKDRATVVIASDDLGRTWSEPRPLSDKAHCPRLALLPANDKHGHRLLLLDFNGRMLHVSADAGRTWQSTLTPRQDKYVIFDRPLELEPGQPDSDLLSAAQQHLAPPESPDPAPTMAQPRTEVTAFVSRDGGKAWTPHSTIAATENLALCEGSVARIDAQTLVCLMRENNQIFEPMYAALSRDNGRTWSEPLPTPLVGHRPTLGVLPGAWGRDRLLATYRDLGPDPGASAWLGSLDELLSGFRVHGPAEALGGQACFRQTPDGLELFNLPEPHWPPRYALRPLTEPRQARATLSAELDASRSGLSGCRIRFAGASLRIFPEHLELQAGLPGNGADTRPEAVPVRPGPLALRLEYQPGLVTLRLQEQDQYRKAAELPVDPEGVRTRPILFGAARTNGMDPTELGSHLWRTVSLRISEPGLGREYAWEWAHGQGLPDAWKRSRVLELDKSRGANFGDFGYTGWTALPDGRVLCVYHHADPTAGDYVPGKTAQLRGVWLEPRDFEAGPGAQR